MLCLAEVHVLENKLRRLMCNAFIIIVENNELVMVNFYANWYV